MRYEKAQDILPQDLLDRLQEFMDGGYLYIPRREENKKTWGNNTGIKKELSERNNKIYNDFKDGMKVNELCNKYYLAPNSIRRILREYKELNR